VGIGARQSAPSMRSKTLSAAALALLASACSAAGTNQSIPTANAGSTVADANGGGQLTTAQTADEIQPDASGTSILKTLTKQTIIGSTVDPKNGDQTPYAIGYESEAPYTPGIVKKGDLVVCNFANKAGTLGSGTTEEVLTAKPGSKPVELVQSTKIEGCAGLSVDQIYGDVYSSDATAKNAVETTDKGKLFETITGGPMVQPYGGTYILYGPGYPPGPGYWAGDATSGVLWRMDLGTGQKKPPVTGVVTGFKVNKGKPGSVLGPTAVAFYKPTDTVYVVDGASNILYSFAHAYYDLDIAKAVVIGSTGKTFTGPAAKDAKVVYSGSALSGPIALAVLANGNVIVANTKSNSLVEIESTGAVLDTKSVDSGAAGAIRGVVAVGGASNTALYFNDVNGNNVQELSK
jgi:hypothetical protein